MTLNAVTSTYSDLSYLLGRNARGISVLGSVAEPSEMTESHAVMSQIAADGIKAELLGMDYNGTSERIYVLKRFMWVAQVGIDYAPRNAFVIVASDNKALSENGIEQLVAAFDLKIPRGNGRYLLAQKARDMITRMPKQRNYLVLE